MIMIIIITIVQEVMIIDANMNKPVSGSDVCESPKFSRLIRKLVDEHDVGVRCYTESRNMALNRMHNAKYAL